MFVTLLSLVLLIAASILALWPSLGIHDHTIDGLFLTVTGFMLSLIFLINFIWQLRYAVAGIRQAWQRLPHVLDLVCLKGGTGMTSLPRRISVLLVMGIVLLLILVFPGRLHASVASASQLTAVEPHHDHVLTIASPKLVPSTLSRGSGEHSHPGALLMDVDVRLRTAAALEGNPALERVAESARVPLRIIVIAARPLLEV
jgi:hypothetical protein